MSIGYLVLPKTKEDVRAARGYLGMKQKEFGIKCKRTEYALNSLETGRHEPKKEFLREIAEYCLGKGIKFLPEGGFRIEKDIVKVYEGEGCFLKLVDDILKTCKVGDEILFIGNDDRKSSEKIIKKDNELYKAGIYPKYLIEKNNDYLLGPIEDYRAVDSKFFVPNDLTIIYKDKVVFDLCENKKDKKEDKILIIKEMKIANKMRKYFYNLWDKGEKIKKSSTKQFFFKEDK